MDFSARIARNISERQLLETRSVLLGVSGGVDSMVLLHVLFSLSQRHGWTLHIAHFNHQLRGLESDQDESFVADSARRLGVPFAAGRGNVTETAKVEKISIEMAARQLRHQFLAETAKQLGTSVIALAHHADDQVETFWMRLLRGDVGAGIAGMRWKRRSSSDPEILIERPMLDIPKAEILGYAREKALPYREDSSNSQLTVQRNRVRHEVLPLLEKIQPELRSITLRSAEILAAEKEFLHERALAWLGRLDPPFHLLHQALQREIIRAQLLKINLPPTLDLIEQLRTNEDTAIAVAPDVAVCRDPTGRVKPAVTTIPSFASGQKKIDLRLPGQAEFHDLEICWKLVPARGAKARHIEYFDAERIGPSASLRFWQPGDRFQPIGMPQETKLQDLFTNLKIPAEERRRRILASTDDGGIFWVEGLRISEGYKVTAQTKTVLEWNWRK